MYEDVCFFFLLLIVDTLALYVMMPEKAMIRSRLQRVCLENACSLFS